MRVEKFVSNLAVQTYMPPETSIRCPFTQRFSSESNAAIIGPMSSGTPARPKAVMPATSLLTYGFIADHAARKIRGGRARCDGVAEIPRAEFFGEIAGENFHRSLQRGICTTVRIRSGNILREVAFWPTAPSAVVGKVTKRAGGRTDVGCA